MVIEILQWAYRKYKVYCFVAFILLTVCLLGYTALIVYWLRNLIEQTRMRKNRGARRPPFTSAASPFPPRRGGGGRRRRPIHLTEPTLPTLPASYPFDDGDMKSPVQGSGDHRATKTTKRPIATAAAADDDNDDAAAAATEEKPTVKINARKSRDRGRDYQLEMDDMTPSPLDRRTSPRRKRRRSYRPATDYDTDLNPSERNLGPKRRWVKLPPFGYATPAPRRTKVSDRLKNERPTYKQYLFV